MKLPVDFVVVSPVIDTTGFSPVVGDETTPPDCFCEEILGAEF